MGKKGALRRSLRFKPLGLNVIHQELRVIRGILGCRWSLTNQYVFIECLLSVTFTLEHLHFLLIAKFIRYHLKELNI